MATVVATYSEAENRFVPLGHKIPLTTQERRRVLASPYRYCVGADQFYIPAVTHAEASALQLCWARIPIGAEWDLGIAADDLWKKLPEHCTLETIETSGIRIGDRYIKRQKEENDNIVPVDLFCSQELINALAENPEALPSVSHSDFEALCAELFVRRGFKVDLFRSHKDDGIDFLALKDDSSDPVIFAVQCKQPAVRLNADRKSVGRPVLQQIYGAAKAWNLTGAILISGSTYSADAKRFADLKPQEMQVYSGADLIAWITKYRWNDDEKP